MWLMSSKHQTPWSYQPAGAYISPQPIPAGGKANLDNVAQHPDASHAPPQGPPASSQPHNAAA